MRERQAKNRILSFYGEKMNGITNSSKKNKRFNLIDLLIILLIIGAIGAAVYYFTTTDLGSNYVDIEYNILVKSTKASYGDKIAIGDKVVDTNQLCELGQVTGITRAPAIVTTVDKDTGRLINTPIPGMISIEITVTVKARVENGLYTVNGVPIMVGEAINFRVPNLSVAGHISSVLVSEENGITS